MLPATGPRPRTIDDLMGPAMLKRLDRLDVMSRKVFAGKLPGERRSKRRGRSVEFDDFRNYVAGDDPRHIDWNAFARLERLLIKVFREEEDLAFHIVVDASPSMEAGDPPKLRFAQRLALALGYIGVVNLNRVVLTSFGERSGSGLVQLSPMRGRRNIRRLAQFILDLGVAADDRLTPPPPPGPRTLTFTEAMRSVALSRRGHGVMVVISDFLVPDDFGAALNYLSAESHGGFDTWCVQVLSPGEIDPGREASRGLIGDLRLTDVETGQAAEVTMIPRTLERYRQRLKEHNERLASACAARGMTCVTLPSDTDLEPLLLDYLRRRGMLR
jgi:uncharacterized protein (DUF58 family)